MSVEQIKNDINLRGHFFDLISRNLVLGLTSVYNLNSKDYIRVHKEYYQAYQNLSNILEGHVKDEDVFDVIQEVSLHYLAGVGRLQFIGNSIDPSSN
jgi:hypothetical protein